jgi:hypothetical protein
MEAWRRSSTESADFVAATRNPGPLKARGIDIKDVRNCDAGLSALGYKKIAVAGDSAGGTLVLGLLLSLKESPLSNLVTRCGSGTVSY